MMGRVELWGALECKNLSLTQVEKNHGSSCLFWALPLRAPHLSVSEVVEDRGQLLGAGVLTLSDDGRVRIPPVHGEPMEPHFTLQQVRLLLAGIEAVDLTSRPRQRSLQGSIVRAQPAAHTRPAL